MTTQEKYNDFNNWLEINSITYELRKKPIYLYEEKEYNLDNIGILYMNSKEKLKLIEIKPILKKSGYIRFNFKKLYSNKDRKIFGIYIDRIWNNLMFKLYVYYTYKLKKNEINKQF